MSKSICILGRQPVLGLAELESLFGADRMRPVGQEAVEIDSETQAVPLVRLGGTQKVCKLLAYLPYSNWRQLEKHLVENVPKHLGFLPEGKLKLGLSAYGISVGPRQINASGLTLKKSIKASGRSVRIVPNTDTCLSTAQTIHNNMTGPLGMELVLIADGQQTVLAQVIAVQDIAAYGARDQARPMRDARVGMLPPKLAQIIVNLARPEIGATVLDPFCGTGVVLQEAALMGFDVYGTDLEPRMVEYSKANLDWLRVDAAQRRISQGDATMAKWEDPFSVIASETYLGRPFSAAPAQNVLRDVMQDVGTILRKFLSNVAGQTRSGFRLCLAIPAWKTQQGFQHLKVLDSLEEIGYTRQSFVHANERELVYHRPNQIVGRELVVLIRK